MKTENINDLKKELENWDAEDADDTNNLLHRYFEATGLSDWCDIGDEACTVYELMFGEKPEEYSPLAAVFDGVAAQAADGVWQAVADGLGLEKRVLESVFEPWYDKTAPCPKAFTPASFKAAYEKEHAWYKENGLLEK